MGSGFRIAMRDLEIRGAGNILGAEQSGHIHAIGFELYTKLLNQAVQDLRAERAEEAAPESEAKSDLRVDLPLSAHIPQDYIGHLPIRLNVYQRLMDLRSHEQIEDMREELRDRFGPLPRDVDNLLYLVSLKIMARQMGVQSIASSDTDITLTLKDSVGGARLIMERSLGGWASVGNRQIKLNRRLMGSKWRAILDLTLAAPEGVPGAVLAPARRKLVDAVPPRGLAEGILVKQVHQIRQAGHSRAVGYFRMPAAPVQQNSVDADSPRLPGTSEWYWSPTCTASRSLHKAMLMLK